MTMTYPQRSSDTLHVYLTLVPPRPNTRFPI